MSYIVTGPLATVKAADGKILYLYKNAPVPEGIDAEQLEHLKSLELIGEVEAHVEDQSPAPAPQGPVERPSDRASKATWVEYAVAQGMTPEDADKLSRDQLAEKYPAE